MVGTMILDIALLIFDGFLVYLTIVRLASAFFGMLFAETFGV